MRTLDTSTARPMPPQRSARSKKVYDSSRWRTRTRPDKLRRDPICQACKHTGRVVEACHVDHWIPIEQGGAAHDDANLVSLCLPHHSTKTRAEQLGRPVPFEIAPSTPRAYTIR